MKSNLYRKRAQIGQAGFVVGPILLVVALITIIAGAIALANRGGSSASASEAVKVQSAVILQQAINQQDGYNRMLAGGLAAAAITFDTTAGSGLFDPALGYAVIQSAPHEVWNLTAGHTIADEKWHYKTSVVVPEVGTASPDMVLVLPDIGLGHCQRINNILYGDVINQAPTTGAGSLANWKALADAVDMSGIVALSGRSEACLATTDARYVYYKTLAIN